MAPTHIATLDCPKCSAKLELEVASAVNVERAPTERERVLDGSFQVHACACGATVRFEAELSYMDLPRKQWIVLKPYPRLGEWGKHEDQTLKLFDVALGDAASQAAQELGAGVEPRLVFGWAALREKLTLEELGLSDVTLECVKLALMKREQIIPQAGQELRLLGLREGALEIASLRPETMHAEAVYSVARSFFDQVEGNADWAPMREKLEGGPFVDAQRLYYDAY